MSFVFVVFDVGGVVPFVELSVVVLSTAVLVESFVLVVVVEVPDVVLSPDVVVVPLVDLVAVPVDTIHVLFVA